MQSTSATFRNAGSDRPHRRPLLRRVHDLRKPHRQEPARPQPVRENLHTLPADDGERGTGEPPVKDNLVLIGMPGVGKSTAGVVAAKIARSD